MNPIKERPILFSGDMVRAILAGRKTQTRRVVKPQPSESFLPTVGVYHPTLVDRDGGLYPGAERFGASDENEGYLFPYGRPGDRLWVKETFYDCRFDTYKKNYEYRADWNADDDAFERDFAWKPSIFMPRDASRITLEIEAVRVERLNQITDADARVEGCCGVASTQWGLPNYRYVWESINGRGSWGKNPWVWVIGFKLINQNGNKK